MIRSQRPNVTPPSNDEHLAGDSGAVVGEKKCPALAMSAGIRSDAAEMGTSERAPVDGRAPCSGVRSRLTHIELEEAGLSRPARIGRMTFSKSGKSVSTESMSQWTSTRPFRA